MASQAPRRKCIRYLFGNPYISSSLCCSVADARLLTVYSTKARRPLSHTFTLSLPQIDANSCPAAAYSGVQRFAAALLLEEAFDLRQLPLVHGRRRVGSRKREQPPCFVPQKLKETGSHIP